MAAAERMQRGTGTSTGTGTGPILCSDGVKGTGGPVGKLGLIFQLEMSL